ncbi:MAG: rhomboid family intramembrane serine protease [Verrucomicrobiota bacterium]
MNGKFQETLKQEDLPIWARHDAFPPARDGFGWIDRKGIPHNCNSLTEISDRIRNDPENPILFVWTPNSDFCQLPDEVDELREPIHEVRKLWAIEDLASSQKQLRLVSSLAAIFIAYTAYGEWMLIQEIEKANGLDYPFFQELIDLLFSLIQSTAVGVALLGFLIFAFIPWYQALKYHREIHLPDVARESAIPVLRFETWLSFQKSPVTKLIFIAIAIVFVAQVIGDLSIIGFDKSIHEAGLVKSKYADGEFSRLFTAPLLHGGLLHFVMNIMALLYLGKRMEVFARWAHLPTVFLFSALMAGEASARLITAPSVGASGGLMGWLGFLLVFETLHHRLVPRTARRRLLAGVFLTALIGLIGYRFIDNAAHFGGLIAGMIYAGMVFPKSSSPLRPSINITDRIVGSVCLTVIFYSSGLAVMRILS